MEKDDKHLVAEYLDGDIKVFAKIVERNLALVYRYAFRMTRDTGDAEDITQETFVKVWRHIKKYNTNQNFSTWLLSIAHNTAIDLLRKRKDFVFSDFDNEIGDFSETIADIAPLPPEIFARAEQKKLLDGALGQLSPAYREILTLYNEEELTFAEIGAILDKSPNTVKSQYRRALLTLRKILESNVIQNSYQP